MRTGNEWSSSKTDIFWNEVAPCDHVVQIYDNDSVFITALAGFTLAGINAEDSVGIIATPAHIQALETRLADGGININELLVAGRYIPLDAGALLARFMVSGWPDEALFNKTITTLIAGIRKENRNIRAFGEMVSLLWAQGQNGATVYLEHLWSQMCEKESIGVFCAYPRSGFSGSEDTTVMNICGAHSKMINGSDIMPAELNFKEIQHHCTHLSC